ncbi:M4 family metallopeptidase [Virgibacillus sp. MSJ-26]|uniref:M4 family metallopeptidase n=1 Tax=Virgibacillus sp. MSJ-26 TaxID=2841522 RepID=UPI001C0FF014|nr:M4 family metallopeptidase [Virgibacillus sp. MSJ-26]MBU5465543.1 M4 family metallopeptidase [Virgibacillus sp. MSJ-26]
MKLTVKVNKKICSSILALSIGFGAAAFSVDSVYAQDNKIQYDDEYKTPSYIIENWEAPHGVSKKEVALSYLEEQFGNLNGDFKVIKAEEDEQTGIYHFKLQQLHMGIPIYGAEQTLALDKNNNITSYFGTVVPGIDIKSTNKDTASSKKLAINRAKQAIEHNIGKVEEYDGKINAEPYIYEYEDKFYQTYLVTASTTEPEVGYWHYFIDPYNGRVIDHFNAAEEVTAFGKGVFGNKQKFEVLQIDNLFGMHDTTRGQGVQTFDASDDMALVTSVSKMFKDGAAVDAHANAQKTYDYYEDTFDRDSVDDNGQPLLSRVHVGDNWNNASWNGTYMSYGDGDGERFHSLAGALDVAAHEMTHGVIQHTSGLIYRNESGALNESIADIFGVMVQRENWLMGEDIIADGTHALRSLEDPASLIESRTQKPYPDHYSKLYTGDLDNGGVHINSSINNKAAHLISEGGEHYGVQVEGVGREATENIYYYATNHYLTPNSDFSAMRQAAVQSAIELYGENSAEKDAVEQAYNAVGVH